MNSSNRYQLVESLYQRAADLPPDRRAAFLTKQCAHDEVLREEVETLLKHYEIAGDEFLSDPIHEFANVGDSRRMPTRIGTFEIVRLIAEGGMGAVFEARQENPRRSVAVKVIRPGMSLGQSQKRFENEAQILAHLQHPAIAHIYEAGVADVLTNGAATLRQPYFAMEYIRGKPLDGFLKDSKADLAKRMELFTGICDAVEYAHQAGIIHRDLKPANILITAEGKPKILDFGVARVTESDVQLTTMHTDVAQVVGTLPYMSPEQVDGHSDRVDMRSDVYALGVILYELVSGRLPYDLSDLPLSRAARVIVEEPPIALGTVVRNCRGDLDTIVRKALQKDPEDRYQSVHDFAADIRRYRNREPIVARPPSAAYQLRKFAQRNPALVGALAATFVALIAGVIGTTTFALGERAQAERARAQTAQAQAITDFLREMVASADPAMARGEELTVRQALDEAARRLATGELHDQPVVESALQHTIGETYISLGHHAAAKPHLEAALATRRKLYGAEHADTIKTLAQLATALSEIGELDEAVRLETEILHWSRNHYHEGDPAIALALENLAVTTSRTGREEDAESLDHEALAIRRRNATTDPLALASCLSSLGALLTKRGEYDKAESPLREALAIRRAALPPDHPDLAYSVSNLGSLLHQRGELAEAEELLTEALAIRERILDPSHPDRLLSINNLAMLLNSVGRRAEAIPLMRQLVESQRQALGDSHPNLGISLLNLASTLSAEGDLEEAERAATEGLEVLRRAFGDRHQNVAIGMHNLAALYMKSGKLEQAEPLVRESIAILTETVGDQHPLTSSCRDTLGSILYWLGRYPESVTELERALADRQLKLGPQHGKVGITWKNLAVARLGLADYGAAQDAARHAADIFRNHQRQGIEYSEAELVLAEAQIRLDDSNDDTIKRIEKARQTLDEAGAPKWMVADAGRVVGLWLARKNRPEEATQAFSHASDSLDCETEVNPFACEVVLHRIKQAELELAQ